MGTFVISYDVGTTGIKTCLFEISDTIRLVASAMEGYKLYMSDKGGAEQNPEDWWSAMCSTTKKILSDKNLSNENIKGISFCSQMQGLVLVDKQGNPVRRAMSYMDFRAEKEFKDGLSNGIKVDGVNVYKLLRSVKLSGAAATSVKDPVWKYKWVEHNEPENYKKIYKWLDVKEFLICRCTDSFIMTQDSAFATMLYDTRKGKERFSEELCRIYGININHLPEVIKSTDMAGKITKRAAADLGLKEGTPVFGGGGDASLIGVGAGAVEEGSTHMYCGTSGWVSTVVKKQVLDIPAKIASVVGAEQGSYNYFAELETAGKCLEWVKDHLALDEIGVYLQKTSVSESKESVCVSLYDYMMEAVKDVPAGSDGVIFTPWLHGNRCPFEDPSAKGMFFNIGLKTGKTEMIHAVIEGICYHLRWQLESQNKKVKTSRTIRFVGGGALAPLTCQIMADVIGADIETTESPQNAGAVGAAVVTAVGLGIINRISEAGKLIKADNRYIPDYTNKATYDKYYEVFKSLYKNNKEAFAALNSLS